MEWDEDTWYNNFLTQKCYYENAKEAYDKCTEHNQQLYDDMMYHYFQMTDCAEHLKRMKQVTKQKIQFYESAFNRGQTVMMFGEAEHNKPYRYTWIPIKDKKDIKKCVLNNIEMKVIR